MSSSQVGAAGSATAGNELAQGQARASWRARNAAVNTGPAGAYQCFPTAKIVQTRQSAGGAGGDIDCVTTHDAISPSADDLAGQLAGVAGFMKRHALLQIPVRHAESREKTEGGMASNTAVNAADNAAANRATDVAERAQHETGK